MVKEKSLLKFLRREREKASTENADTIIKYTMYIGLNDKDTKKQEITTEKAINLVCGILANNGITDVTIYNSLGCYTHEDGERVTENSLIVTMFFIEYIQISNVIVDLKEILNQECIILEKQEINSQCK